jgi:hypothetical protein
MRRRKGNRCASPDPEVINNAIADYGPLAPAGYGTDFAILTNGRTVLVEINDGYSLGTILQNSGEYAE